MAAETVAELTMIHDNHSHVSLYAAFEGLPDLSGLGKGSALELLQALPGDRLSLVKGWRTDSFSLDPRDLANLPPAVIVNASLHGFAMTRAAVPFVRELWPELADHAGDPTWCERALSDIFAFYVRLAGIDLGKLESFMARMESLGIGSLDDMTISGEEAIAIVGASRFANRIACWATPGVYRRLEIHPGRSARASRSFSTGRSAPEARRSTLPSPTGRPDPCSIRTGSCPSCFPR